MTSFIEFFSDLTMAAAITTASHFGIAIESPGAKAQPSAVETRSVRRTAPGDSSSRPAPRSVRSGAH